MSSGAESVKVRALTFRASSSDPQVAAVTVAGAVLMVTPVVPPRQRW